jgi:hypothetical protein
MAQTRDLWDTLQALQYATQPNIDSQGEILNAFQTPRGDTVLLSDGVSIPNRGHTGVYNWNAAATRWGLFQWG